SPTLSLPVAHDSVFRHAGDAALAHREPAGAVLRVDPHPCTRRDPHPLSRTDRRTSAPGPTTTRSNRMLSSTALVPQPGWIDGERRLSFTRTSAVVNCQSTRHLAVLRVCSHVVASARNSSVSLMRPV